MQSFEFKPAIMRGRISWTLDSGFVTKDGEPFCNLAAIDRATFAEMTVRYTHSAWFDMFDGKTRYRITCNMPEGDEHNIAFKRLTAAILGEIETRKPDLQVAFGAGGGIRTAMFLIGLLAAVFGLIILVSLMGGGVRTGRSLGAFAFGTGFTLFGAWLGWSYRPWAPVPTLPVGVARHVIAGLAGNKHPANGQDGPEQ